MTDTPPLPAASITGLGVLGPCGRGPEALWRSLLSGESNRRRIAHFETFDSPLATVGLVPGEESRAGDPERVLELVVAAAGDALADAGLGAETEVALVVGTTDCGGNALAAARRPGDGRAAAADPRARFSGWLAEAAAERLGLGGEAVTVGSASASGGSALCLARDLLAAGEAEVVVAAGADAVTESAFQGLRSLRTLGVDGCRPFNAERSGIGIAEGAAALVLERPGRPGGNGRPPRARLLGCGSDNRADGLAVSDVAGIAAAIEAALADAGLDPAAVGTVNAHGPGTRRGDVAEIEALRVVFGDRLSDLSLVSVKGALWHWQGAAGVVEALACVLSHSRATVPPTHGAAPVDSRWRDLDIVLEPRAIGPGASVSVSCGLGGINTVAVLAP